VLQDHSELIIDDEVFAGNDYTDGKKFYVLHSVVGWENALPDSEGIEEGEILSIEQGDPSETVKERVDFEFLHPFPDVWLDDLSN